MTNPGKHDTADQRILSQIHEKLREVEEQEQVRILYAVESGSRAWGFASPDSDYDVRFIYVRKEEDYLRLDGFRDVIEWQLDQVLDVNGWDLRKALAQFQKGNATLFEWAKSPVVYQSSQLWEQVYAAGRRYFSVKTAVSHYYGTARSTYVQYLQGGQVKYKKYFYALRPLLAARYIEKHGCSAPILFEELMEQELPDGLREELRKALQIKMATGEGERYARNEALHTFISQELDRQKALAAQLADDRKRDWGPLNAVFLEAVRKA